MADTTLISFEKSVDLDEDESMGGRARSCCGGIDWYTLGFAVLIIAIYLVGGIMWYSWWEQWSYLDALYFSVVCTTTVGYGDLAPSDYISRLFTVGYIFFAIAGAGTAIGTSCVCF